MIKNNKLTAWRDALLRQYFKVENGRVTAELYFDTFAELIDPNLGDDSVEMLTGDFFMKLDEMLSLIPRKYKIDVLVKIRDFGGYTEDEAQGILRSNLALQVYARALELRRKQRTALVLLGGGVLLLLASYLLGDLAWPQLIFDIINISGTLLVWEAGSIYFIERSEEIKRTKQYVRKLTELRVVAAGERKGNMEECPDSLSVIKKSRLSSSKSCKTEDNPV